MKLINYPKSKTAKGWKVEIPATLAGGKRRREFFKTREEANKRVSDLNNEIQNFGSGASQIAPQHYHDAANAIALLEGTDMTLTKVVKDWLARSGSIKKSVTLVECAQLYINDDEIELTDFVARNYVKTCRRISKAFYDVPTHDLTAEHFKEGLKAFTPKSVNTHKAHVNAVLNWGAEKSQGFHIENVLSELKKRKKRNQSDHKPMTLDHDEVETFLNEVRQFKEGRYLPYYILSIFAGLRRSEVGRITWDDIDLKRGHVFISRLTSKTEQSRYVKLMPNVLQWLQLCNKSEPILSVPVKRQNILRKKSGIKWQRNIMRHTACSMHYGYYQDENALTSWAGHSLRVFFKHYQNAVLKEDAIRFWSITPDGQPTQLLQSVI